MENGNLVKEQSNDPEKELKNTRFKAAVYFIGFSTLVGVTAGAVSARIAKKRSYEYYKDMNVQPKVVPETAVHLAFRALAWSTFYSIGICSLAVLGACKWFHISSLEDLQTTVRRYSRRNKESEGRTEFESFSDFLNYLNDPSHSKQTKGK